jgi:hypothetical protein
MAFIMKKLFIFTLLFISTNILAKTEDPFYTPFLDNNISEYCGLNSKVKSTFTIRNIQPNHFRLLNTKKCHNEIERFIHSYDTVLADISKYEPDPSKQKEKSKISSEFLMIYSKVASLLIKHNH